MKKMFVLVAILAMAMTFVSITVWAQETPTTNYVEGAVRLLGQKNFGNDTIGSFSLLNSGAGFNIPGNQAKGTAFGKGLLNANGSVGENSLNLDSSVLTKTGARQLQGDPGQIHVDGVAQRGSWGTLKNGPSFISGWDSSRADYVGNLSGLAPSGLGKGLARGTLELSLLPNGSLGKITNNSLTLFRGTPGQVDPSVQGNAGLTAGTILTAPGFSAAASTDSAAAYKASDPRKVSGGLEINSSTVVSQKPDGSISLGAKTDAVVHTRPGPVCK